MPQAPSSSWRLVLIAVVLLGGWALARFTRPPAGPPPGGVDPARALPQAAYVRERFWNDAVRTAVRGATGVAAEPPDASASPASGEPLVFDSLCVLVAELTPTTPANVTVTRPASLDWPLLAGLPRPVSLLIRLRAVPSAGGGEDRKGDAQVGPEREPFPTLRRVLDETLAETVAVGLRPAEIQLQFDCPTTQLAGYAAALEALRAAYPAQTFRPVARPSWLRVAEFAPLARAAGGYVLDLQGLERRGAESDNSGGSGRRVPETLLDPDAAVDAVAAASELRVPFRVSLPASGYRLTVGADGRLLASTAEPRSLDRGRPPADSSERTLRANVDEMARLVAEWNWRRPEGLTGILWDRLPVPSAAGPDDRLDWAPQTFRAVRSGKVPRSKLEWNFPDPVEGSDRRELGLRNVGDADAPLPPVLTVRCPQPPIAVEAVAPYEVVPPSPKERLAPGEVRFRLSRASVPSTEAAPRTLAPGATRLFGAVRLPPGGQDPDAPGPDEIGAALETLPAAKP